MDKIRNKPKLHFLVTQALEVPLRTEHSPKASIEDKQTYKIEIQIGNIGRRDITSSMFDDKEPISIIFNTKSNSIDFLLNSDNTSWASKKVQYDRKSHVLKLPPTLIRAGEINYFYFTSDEKCKVGMRNTLQNIDAVSNRKVSKRKSTETTPAPDRSMSNRLEFNHLRRYVLGIFSFVLMLLANSLWAGMLVILVWYFIFEANALYRASLAYDRLIKHLKDSGLENSEITITEK